MKTSHTFSRPLALFLVLLPIVTALGVWIFGRYEIGPAEILRTIGQALIGSPNLDPLAYTVVVKIRLSRILLALLVGSGLSVGGVAYQSLFGNPLTTPDILGVAAGAAFGAALGLLADFSPSAVQLTALLFGLGAVGLSLLFARQKGKTPVLMLILSGVVVSSLFSALLAGTKYVADPQSKLPAITFWLMGSLNGANFKNLTRYAPAILISCAALWTLRWKLNILALPEDEARSLGLNVKALRLAVILCGTVITASAVALCGIIGWVGLLIPHLCRLMFGVNTAKLVPATLSLGAVFMVLVDTMARTLLPGEIPIGILCSLIGAPVFVLLLRHRGGML